MNYNKLRLLISESKMSIEDVALKIGKSRSGLHQTLKNETITVQVLEEICKLLEIKVSYFFDEENRAVNEISDQDSIYRTQNKNVDENLNLYELISQRDKTITELFIQLLEKDKLINKLVNQMMEAKYKNDDKISS